MAAKEVVSAANAAQAACKHMKAVGRKGGFVPRKREAQAAPARRKVYQLAAPRSPLGGFWIHLQMCSNLDLRGGGVCQSFLSK